MHNIRFPFFPLAGMMLAGLLLLPPRTAAQESPTRSADRSEEAETAHAAQARTHPQPVFSGQVPLRRSPLSGILTHAVHGYHPYWISDAAADNYRWNLLSHLAYFSYEVDPASGEALTVRNWRTTTVIDRAKTEGVSVLLAVTNFGAANNRTLLTSPAARDTLITRLIGLVQERGANGVSIDFEAVPGDQRENLVTFFSALRTRLDAEIPDAVISTAAPAVDWNSAWDVAALAASVDLFFVMCYDYSWSSSSNAGPVAPIRGMTYNVDRTLRWYLAQGVPQEKLLMGVPYYGYDWPVISSSAGAATTGRGTARTYSAAASSLQNRSRQWSEVFLNPWIAYESSSWQQLWYDDAESLEFKYALVKDLGIAGIGMWALGYDADLPELWDLIERMFTRPAAVNAPPAPSAVAIWPQPLRAGTSAYVRLPAEFTQDGSRRSAVFDLLGRIVAEPLPERLADEIIRFTVPDLSPGVYVLDIGGVRNRIVVTQF